jgi:hypothetical protein
MNKRHGDVLSVVVVIAAGWLADARPLRAEVFAVQRAEDRISVTRDGRPVGAYVVRDPKIMRPYWTGLCAPDGTQVTRRHPPVAGEDAVDHDTMHPGLWIAFGDLNGVDFWRNKGRIEHVRFVAEPEADAERAWFAVEDRYLAPTGEEVCRGVSEFCVVSGAGLEPGVAGTVILIATTLWSDRGPLVFGPQHEMGLGIRIATALTVKNGTGTIAASHGGTNEAGTWGRVGRWWDYSGTIDGRRAGMLLAAARDNPRAVWAHSRDYGFLALNPTGPPRRPVDGEPSEPFTLAKGKVLRLAFAALLHAESAVEEWEPAKVGEAVAATLDSWQPRAPAVGGELQR